MVNIKDNRGFTLLELIVSLTIMSMMSLGFFLVIQNNIKSNVKNEKDIKLLQIAQSEIENLRNQIKNSDSETFTTFKSNIDEYNSITEESITISIGENIYTKALSDDSNIYDINLRLSKDEKLDIYTIDIKVESENKDFTKKNINLITKIFRGK